MSVSVTLLSVHPNPAPVIELLSHPCIDLRAVLPCVKCRPETGKDHVHLSVDLTIAAAQHRVAPMLDQTRMAEPAVDDSCAAGKEVMGFTTIPEAPIDEQQVQRT
jgi:hypothetical protein